MPTTALSVIAGLIPSLDSEIQEYITSYFDESSSSSSSDDEDDDDGSAEEGIQQFVRPLLEGEGIEEEEISAAIEQLQRMFERANPAAGTSKAGPSGASKARRLEKAIDMKSNPAISFTASLVNGPVDIESTTKSRNTQVDIKKLEKAEAKIKAKMDKRANRSLISYEGSKLVDAAKAQKEYEEMYMKVNPLQSQIASNKGKSKDILLDAIDVSFASHSILSNARWVAVPDLLYPRLWLTCLPPLCTA